jgi:hypothetical protein
MPLHRSLLICKEAEELKMMVDALHVSCAHLELLTPS